VRPGRPRAAAPRPAPPRSAPPPPAPAAPRAHAMRVLGSQAPRDPPPALPLPLQPGKQMSWRTQLYSMICNAPPRSAPLPPTPAAPRARATRVLSSQAQRDSPPALPPSPPPARGQTGVERNLRFSSAQQHIQLHHAAVARARQSVQLHRLRLCLGQSRLQGQGRRHWTDCCSVSRLNTLQCITCE